MAKDEYVGLEDADEFTYPNGLDLIASAMTELDAAVELEKHDKSEIETSV